MKNMPAELMPWAIIWNMAPFMPNCQYCDPVGAADPHAEAEHDVAHVAHRAVGHQLLEIGLGHGGERAVDHADDAEDSQTN